ncbi:hypothetical protein [Actinoplanes teichomyceticus]|uniref:FXSXX-COOH protein n=1 Tax=Actinoplanes teichomyceticus TaxID=1867 RepID=A0A561VLL8_ACTTI|nr:hypothetical protein [Actinoplanes teichomyceticus]TWG12508.1 hypothetical protein FHX34_105375 [Actinoplanes teichomyceticus]GIF13872.1 hypothetical protein Ate01nite_39040 [Actinoplanes teichomyceticus]
MDLIEDQRRDLAPLEDLRRTPLGGIDPRRAAEVARAQTRDEAERGRIDSALFGSAI